MAIAASWLVLCGQLRTIGRCVDGRCVDGRDRIGRDRIGYDGEDTSWLANFSLRSLVLMPMGPGLAMTVTGLPRAAADAVQAGGLMRWLSRTKNGPPGGQAVIVALHGAGRGATPAGFGQSIFRYSRSAVFSSGVNLVPNSWPQLLLPEERSLQSVCKV